VVLGAGLLPGCEPPFAFKGYESLRSTEESVNPGEAEQRLLRNVQRFRGGLVFKAHRLLYHSTLGLRVINKEDPGEAEADLRERAEKV